MNEQLKVFAHSTIGEGGNGRIFRAQITKANGETTVVAVKKPKAETPAAINKLIKIQTSHNKLEHANIVKVVGVSDQGVWLEMMQTDLHGLNDNLPWETWLQLCAQAARGMHYLHSRGFVHTDIKPGNVLVDLAEPNADSPPPCSHVAKIGDLDSICEFAEYKRRVDGYKKALHDGRSLFLTGRYAPPELSSQPRLQLPSEYDGTKADVYGFGHVMQSVKDKTRDWDNKTIFAEENDASTVIETRRLFYALMTAVQCTNPADRPTAELIVKLLDNLIERLKDHKTELIDEWENIFPNIHAHRKIIDSSADFTQLYDPSNITIANELSDWLRDCTQKSEHIDFIELFKSCVDRGVISRVIRVMKDQNGAQTCYAYWKWNKESVQHHYNMLTLVAKIHSMPAINQWELWLARCLGGRFPKCVLLSLKASLKRFYGNDAIGPISEEAKNAWLTDLLNGKYMPTAKEESLAAEEYFVLDDDGNYRFADPLIAEQVATEVIKSVDDSFRCLIGMTMIQSINRDKLELLAGCIDELSCGIDALFKRLEASPEAFNCTTHCTEVFSVVMYIATAVYYTATLFFAKPRKISHDRANDLASVLTKLICDNQTFSLLAKKVFNVNNASDTVQSIFWRSAEPIKSVLFDEPMTYYQFVFSYNFLCQRLNSSDDDCEYFNAIQEKANEHEKFQSSRELAQVLRGKWKHNGVNSKRFGDILNKLSTNLSFDGETLLEMHNNLLDNINKKPDVLKQLIEGQEQAQENTKLEALSDMVDSVGFPDPFLKYRIGLGLHCFNTRVSYSRFADDLSMALHLFLFHYFGEDETKKKGLFRESFAAMEKVMDLFSSSSVIRFNYYSILYGIYLNPGDASNKLQIVIKDLANGDTRTSSYANFGMMCEAMMPLLMGHKYSDIERALLNMDALVSQFPHTLNRNWLLYVKMYCRAIKSSVFPESWKGHKEDFMQVFSIIARSLWYYLYVSLQKRHERSIIKPQVTDDKKSNTAAAEQSTTASPVTDNKSVNLSSSSDTMAQQANTKPQATDGKNDSTCDPTIEELVNEIRTHLFTPKSFFHPQLKVMLIVLVFLLYAVDFDTLQDDKREARQTLLREDFLPIVESLFGDEITNGNPIMDCLRHLVNAEWMRINDKDPEMTIKEFEDAVKGSSPHLFRAIGYELQALYLLKYPTSNSSTTTNYTTSTPSTSSASTSASTSTSAQEQMEKRFMSNRALYYLTLIKAYKQYNKWDSGFKKLLMLDATIQEAWQSVDLNRDYNVVFTLVIRNSGFSRRFSDYLTREQLEFTGVLRAARWLAWRDPDGQPSVQSSENSTEPQSRHPPRSTNTSVTKMDHTAMDDEESRSSASSVQQQDFNASTASNHSTNRSSESIFCSTSATLTHSSNSSVFGTGTGTDGTTSYASSSVASHTDSFTPSESHHSTHSSADSTDGTDWIRAALQIVSNDNPDVYRYLDDIETHRNGLLITCLDSLSRHLDDFGNTLKPKCSENN